MSRGPAAVQIDAQSKGITEGVVSVEYVTEVSDPGPSYFMLIDLDNGGGSGPYKHDAYGAIQILSASAALSKGNVSAQWDMDMGVILSIDGVRATIAFFESGSVAALNTSAFGERIRGVIFPVTASLEIEAGDLKYIATNFKVTTTDVNTGMTLEDVGGNSRTPAVGDLVIRAERLSGTGTANLFYTMTYRTVS